jgi:hypothetical protein
MRKLGLGASVTLALGLAGAPAAIATGWSIQRIPSPGRTSSELTGVSCWSPSACFAVGGYSVASYREATLAERWNGRRWSIQPTPTPPGGTLNGLLAVSCTSPSACIAVGTQENPTSQAPLVERWNGKRWSIQPTPNVFGGLFGVSCASRTACTAVGAKAPGPLRPLAERWTGKRWSIQPTPAVYSGVEEDLEAVSCPSTTACFAVGTGTAMGSGAIAERWDGSKWSIERPSNRPAGGTALEGVSCISPSACITVGERDDGGVGLTGRWSPTSWPVALSSGGPGLMGVSCPAVTVCTAVGGYSSYIGVPRFGSPLLAERWNGIRWSVQPTPSPASAQHSGFAAVSCPSPTSCTAVGSYLDSGGKKRVLIERWTGTG